MVDDCCLTTTRQVIATFHRVKPEVARDQDTWRDVTETPIVLRIMHLTPPLAEWSVLVSSNTDHWPGGVGALDRSTIIHRHLRYVTDGSFCFRSLVVSLIHTTLNFGIISPWSGYLLTAMVDVTLIRPLNKGQGHSFWYQSISHIRLPIGSQ